MNKVVREILYWLGFLFILLSLSHSLSLSFTSYHSKKKLSISLTFCLHPFKGIIFIVSLNHHHRHHHQHQFYPCSLVFLGLVLVKKEDAKKKRIRQCSFSLVVFCFWWWYGVVWLLLFLCWWWWWCDCDSLGSVFLRWDEDRKGEKNERRRERRRLGVWERKKKQEKGMVCELCVTVKVVMW